jgi:hypothetical protein
MSAPAGELTSEEKLERERDTAIRVAEEAMRLLSDAQLVELKERLDLPDDKVVATLQA